MAEFRCPIRACAAPLEAVVERGGRVRWACPMCARRKAGVCRDCPTKIQRPNWRCARCRLRHLARVVREKKRHGSARLARYTPKQLARKDAGQCVECAAKVEGRAWRCADCKHREMLRASRRHYRRHHDRVLSREKARYQQNPDARDRRNAYKKRWRQANRRQVLMQKRKARLAGKPNGYATPEKYAAYQRAYRERNRERLAATARERQRRLNPPPTPTCRECGHAVPWDGKHRPRSYCPAHAPAWRVYADRRKSVA